MLTKCSHGKYFDVAFYSLPFSHMLGKYHECTQQDHYDILAGPKL